MKQTVKSVFANLLGDHPVDFYITFFACVLIGTIISLGWSISKRDKYSESTPRKFNLWFFLLDNTPRFLANMALIFVIIRFGSEVFGVIPNYWGAVLLGLSSDRLAHFGQKLKDIAREKFADKE